MSGTRISKHHPSYRWPSCSYLQQQQQQQQVQQEIVGVITATTTTTALSKISSSSKISHVFCHPLTSAMATLFYAASETAPCNFHL
jgi:hypothetical protein